MKKQIYLLSGMLFLMTITAFAQVQKAQTLQIGNTSTNSQNASAALQVDETNRGFLPPRLTSTQRNAITNPATGLSIYNSTTNCMEWYNGLGWYNACGGALYSNSSGGSAIVSGYSCSTASAGTMTAGTAVSGVTQTITATVTTAGTYNISASANGVTFTGSGTFTGTGNQTVILTASGTPTYGGNSIAYNLNTTPTCSFTRVCVGYPAGYTGFQTAIVEVTSASGRVWMDRNLGASQMAQSSTDYLAYGKLFQWGRGDDGHADINRTSSTTGNAVNGTTSVLSTTDTPGNSLFITNVAGNADWRATKNDNLWQGLLGINNPCPAGYRLPKLSEWDTEMSTYNITNSVNAFSSPLKITVAGMHTNSGNSLADMGSWGYYWSSTVSGAYASYKLFSSTGMSTVTLRRSYGYSVRCIKD